MTKEPEPSDPVKRYYQKNKLEKINMLKTALKKIENMSKNHKIEEDFLNYNLDSIEVKIAYHFFEHLQSVLK